MAYLAANGNSYCRIRYPDPAIKVNDTVKIDLSTGKISDFIRFDTGVIAMATGGRNMGRVGVITHRERHDGGFNIVHIKDAIDNSFATRETNVFVIGNEKPWISLPKGKGVKVRFRWSFSTRPPESMLIVISCPLQRRGIVVVLMQLQATRLPGTGSPHRLEDQYSISSSISDLKTRSSNCLECYRPSFFDCGTTKKLPHDVLATRIFTHYASGGSIPYSKSQIHQTAQDVHICNCVLK